MKYKLTNETLQHNGRTLYRIEALKSFSIIRAGDKGGWVESEDNLSQKGHCWVADEAKVYGWARVYEDAFVSDTAEVCEAAIISDMAMVWGDARVRGRCQVYSGALVETGEHAGSLHIFSKRERVRR